MKKNRKMSKKMSVMAGRTVQIGAVMAMVFVVVIFNMLAQSSCKHLEKSIREKERQLTKLDEEKAREEARWGAMETNESLDAALLRHGLAMKLPRAAQQVRLKSDGTPYPGQISVAKASARNRASQTAQYTVPRPAAVASVRPAAARPAAPRPAAARASAPRASAPRAAAPRAASRPAAARPAVRSTASKGARR
jgi:hypothetical protein